MPTSFRLSTRRFVAVFAVALLAGLPFSSMLSGNAAHADALARPSGPVILTITGNIESTNNGDAAQFDREMLEALGVQALSTTNPFETGIQNFEGVLLDDVLKRVGATGDKLIAHALDGYIVEIPAADARQYPVLLAMTWNGTKMTVRNKGPIWIIYPVDQFPKINNKQYSGRSIWQLTRLVIE